MNEIKLKILSLIGGRTENQDSSGYQETEHGHLIVVCDGMGGAKGGKTASELAIQTIIEQVNITKLTETDEILIEAIKVANCVVYQTGRSNPDLQGMGTTVVALLIEDEKATAAHIGDSRIYQVRGSRKVFRTFDHSMVFELVKRGTITEEQARLSAESNVILRAIGIKPEVEVEINRDLPYVKGDRFLLCSDGVCGAVNDKELVKLIKQNMSVDLTAEMLVETIDKIGLDNGGNHDNLTAAIIEVTSNSKLKTKMDKRSKIIIGIITCLFLISLAINVKIISKYNQSSTDIKRTDSILVLKKTFDDLQYFKNRYPVKVAVPKKDTITKEKKGNTQGRNTNIN